MNQYEGLLNTFEQCYSLEAYKALQKGTAIGDEEYITQVREGNERVVTAFFMAGKEGLDYLLQTLEHTSPDQRERAVVIIGELGTADPSLSKEITSALKERLREEPERCVKGRIEYALQKNISD